MREMKDSGIAWIGEIPKEWKICRLKDNTTIIRGGSPRPIENFISDEGYNWIKISDTTKGCKYINQTQVRIKKSGLSKTRFVHKNDLILTNSMSFGNPYILNIDGCIHDGWVAITIRKNINKEFLYYMLLSSVCETQFKQQVDGGVVQNLNIEKIGVTTICLPNISEQQRIATFLDEKCKEIDALIDLQEEMITELQAYKQSVISEAVTKGLNPKVTMKDSGVEWIGDIPEHWEVKRLKFSCEFFGRIGFRGYKSEDLVNKDEGAITLSPSNMQNMGMSYTKCTYLSWDKYYESPEIMIAPSDVLVVKTGSTYGKCSFVETIPRESTINPQIVVLKNHKDNSKFIAYSFQTPFAKSFIDTTVVGGTIPTISQEKMRNYHFVFPSLSEQKEIVDYLDTQCTRIDSLITLKQAKIESLKEYKKSVIYEYVTGKKEVPATV